MLNSFIYTQEKNNFKHTKERKFFSKLRKVFNNFIYTQEKNNFKHTKEQCIVCLIILTVSPN